MNTDIFLFFIRACVIYCLMLTCNIIKHVDGSPTKIIVKINPGQLSYVQHEFLVSNFTLYRNITDNIFVFATNSSDEFFDKDFYTDELLSKVHGKVDYLYKSYDLFRPSPVAAGAVSGGSETGVTKIPLQVGENYQVCSPVYDPLFGIDDAWQRNITGKGVVIAITDVGVDSDHPKLEANINKSLCWNFVDTNDDIAPEYYPNEQRLTPLTNHGNACAGLAAGIRNISARCQPCGCGTAPDASLAVLKVGRVPEDEKARIEPHAHLAAVDMCASLGHHTNDIDIYSNSWNFRTSFHIDDCIRDIIQKGYQEGRNSKGNIYVFPADPPGNGLVNNIYTIAVGDMGVDGTLPDNYQVNSAVLVCMFTSGTRKNDTRLVVDIHTGNVKHLSPCSIEFGGQSATCAMAAGVIALVLQVNPGLTVRDVRHILVQSASNTDIAEESSFKTNAAGYKYHNVLGFGYPNVNKMISLAENWTTLSALRTDDFVFNIRGNTASSQVLSDRINKLEQVQIYVKIAYTKKTNLSMEVISPHTTKSVLFYNITIELNNTQLTIMSNHFWGENPNGDWTMRIFSLLGSQSASVIFMSARIQLHGTGADFASSTTGNILDDGSELSVGVLNINKTPRVDQSTTMTTNSSNTESNDSKKWIYPVIAVIIIIVIISAIVVVRKYKINCCRRTQLPSNIQDNEDEQTML